MRQVTCNVLPATESAAGACSITDCSQPDALKVASHISSSSPRKSEVQGRALLFGPHTTCQSDQLQPVDFLKQRLCRQLEPVQQHQTRPLSVGCLQCAVHHLRLGDHSALRGILCTAFSPW